MALLDWFTLKQREMDFVYRRAEELRAKHGSEAEHWCEVRLDRAHETIERRTLRQIRKVLKHVR